LPGIFGLLDEPLLGKTVRRSEGAYEISEPLDCLLERIQLTPLSLLDPVEAETAHLHHRLDIAASTYQYGLQISTEKPLLIL
jgi:hypothetical protein